MPEWPNRFVRPEHIPRLFPSWHRIRGRLGSHLCETPNTSVPFGSKPPQENYIVAKQIVFDDDA
ncbi:hypothetical protein, partial [Rhodopirellula bahusiensis]|uniref:hypothetical protein n=1 Tax=Rhodopirellula bahusiensis TaxID=2014065 RepID=UPI00326444C7